MAPDANGQAVVVWQDQSKEGASNSYGIYAQRTIKTRTSHQRSTQLLMLTISEDSGEQTVNLSGISAGSGESQGLTVTATSSDPGLIPNPTVTYTSPNATGSLSYTPVANQSGVVTITVTVTDDGDTANGGVNTITRTFNVTVNAVNDAPTLDPIPDPAPISEDAGVQTINLSGISAGGGSRGESQGLDVHRELEQLRQLGSRSHDHVHQPRYDRLPELHAGGQRQRDSHHHRDDHRRRRHGQRWCELGHAQRSR